MKRGLLLLVLFVLAAPVAAQRPASQTTAPQPSRATALMLKALRAEPSAAPRASGKNTADRVETATQAMWNGQAWSDTRHRRHVYNGETLVAIEFYRDEGASWVFESRLLYTLDDGRPVEELYELTSDDGATWEPASRELYSYAGDLMSEYTVQTWSGAWQNAEHVRFEHDAAGLPIVIETSIWDAGSWRASERAEAVESNFDLQLTYSEWDGSVWQPVEQQLFSGRRLADVVALLRLLEEAMDLLPESMYALTYLPDHVNLIWDGQAWRNDWRQSTSHRFVNNEPVEADVRDEVWDGQAWIAMARRLVALAPAALGHRPTSLSFELGGEGGWEPVAVDHFEYDARGNLSLSAQQIATDSGMENFTRWSLAWLDSGVAIEDDVLPTRYRLDPAYPNPFNPATTVPYHLAQPGRIVIRVYDALGRQVATLVDGVQPAGEHVVRFEAGDLPSGMYLVRLEADAASGVQAVTLVR